MAGERRKALGETAADFVNDTGVLCVGIAGGAWLVPRIEWWVFMIVFLLAWIANLVTKTIRGRPDTGGTDG